MALDADNVVVGGTGHIYVAPAGTSLPAALAAVAAPWVELGYTGEDGVTFGTSRETEEVNAWQSAEPVRTLITSEPKTVAFELLEFGNPDAIELALRGGSFAVATGVATYTPPAAGGSDERALVIDVLDGAYTFRYAFASVELTGDVEWSALKSDATRLPLEFAVQAGGWKIMSDHPSWVAATLAASAGDAPAADLIAAMPAASDADLDLLAKDDRATVSRAAKDERKRRAAADEA